MSEFAGTIAPVYEALIHSLETGAPHPCDGAGGRRAMEMISAVFASHFAGRPLSLPLQERGDPLAPPR
jgi:predicted dehydrogenase